MNIKIGTVTINYDENGFVLERETFFEPQMKIGIDGFVDQIQKVKCSNDTETLKSNADLVFGGWFAKMNEIELADREQFEISSNVIECGKHDNGMVSKCIIEYSFNHR